jgi:hypothetical protein
LEKIDSADADSALSLTALNFCQSILFDYVLSSTVQCCLSGVLGNVDVASALSPTPLNTTFSNMLANMKKVKSS